MDIQYFAWYLCEYIVAYAKSYFYVFGQKQFVLHMVSMLVNAYEENYSRNF
jgi:hypothetical protein